MYTYWYFYREFAIAIKFTDMEQTAGAKELLQSNTVVKLDRRSPVNVDRGSVNINTSDRASKPSVVWRCRWSTKTATTAKTSANEEKQSKKWRCRWWRRRSKWAKRGQKQQKRCRHFKMEAVGLCAKSAPTQQLNSLVCCGRKSWHLKTRIILSPRFFSPNFNESFNHSIISLIHVLLIMLLPPAPPLNYHVDSCCLVTIENRSMFWLEKIGVQSLCHLDLLFATFYAKSGK